MNIPFLRCLASERQRQLGIPACFELSEEKLKSDDVISDLLARLTLGSIHDGDRFALMEIIKEWLTHIEEGAK